MNLQIPFVPLALLTIPYLAGADWSMGDYALAAALIWGLSSFLRFLLARPLSWQERAGLALGLAAAVFLVVSNAALGIIGSEDHPANRLYLAVPVLGLAGAVLTRLRIKGLSGTLIAMALLQTLIAPLAYFAGIGTPWPHLPQIALVNLFFAGLFLTSGLLLRQSDAGLLASTDRG